METNVQLKYSCGIMIQCVELWIPLIIHGLRFFPSIVLYVCHMCSILFSYSNVPHVNVCNIAPTVCSISFKLMHWVTVFFFCCAHLARSIIGKCDALFSAKVTVNTSFEPNEYHSNSTHFKDNDFHAC